MAALPDEHSRSLRMIDYLKIPREHGDCVVLIVAHPGLNILGRYLPSCRINDLLLADVSRARSTSLRSDVYMIGVDEPDIADEIEPLDIMDLASFLEYVYASSGVSTPKLPVVVFL